MKKVLIAALLFPAVLTAQVKSPTKAKPTSTKEKNIRTTEGFDISGTITGYADGTKIALLNGQTGAPEMQSTIEKNHFSFKGKLDKPAFKIVIIENKPPYLTIFLDNSSVIVSGSKEAFDKAMVTGSDSHKDFETLNNSLLAYQGLFAENAPRDPALVAAAKQTLHDFISQHTASFITPLAVIRYNQLAPDELAVTEKLFNTLPEAVKSTDMGSYIAQQIAEGKFNAVGTELGDFTQADTEGNPVKLSSLRGKYVLVDFWASWCRPCRQENPNVVANFNKFKDKNFTVLGVSLDKAKPAWMEAIAQDGLTWPHVSDLLGWSNAVAQQFKIQSIPQNFLIGPDGKIIAKNLRGAALEQKLAELLP